MCAYPLEEPPFTRPLTPLLSPVGPPAVCLRVSSAIKRSQARPGPDTEVIVSLSHGHSTQERGHLATSKIQVMGPYTPQYMEVTDSSTGSLSSTRSSPSRTVDHSCLFRSKSTSSLPDTFSRPQSLIQELSPVNSVKSFTGIIYREAIFPKDKASRSSPGSPITLAGGEEDSRIPSAVIYGRNNAQLSRNTKVDQSVITQLLHECLGNEQSPPPQTPLHHPGNRHKTSLDPSTPPSPTEGIRAVAERQSLARTASPMQSTTSTESDGSVPGRKCSGCGRKKTINQWMRLVPCQHVTCSTCFSAILSATTVTRGHSTCPSCFAQIYTFASLSNRLPLDYPGQIMSRSQRMTLSSTLSARAPYPVLRIDNVAWDITPQAVEDYLPHGSLPPDHPQPIHILLNRLDGRTKDYMYIEVVNENAVRRVMKRCQNSYMPGGPFTGGRKRPVTITSVPPHELLNELRPKSAAELNSLLDLCHIAVSVPQLAHPTLGLVPPIISVSGAAHYVKSRHGPFYAVMSILSKLQGRTSPAYWDVFFLASGAIKILAQSTAESSTIKRRLTPEECRLKAQDDLVLERRSSLFHSTFRNFKD